MEFGIGDPGHLVVESCGLVVVAGLDARSPAGPENTEAVAPIDGPNALRGSPLARETLVCSVMMVCSFDQKSVREGHCRRDDSMSDRISCQVGCGTGDASLCSIREGQVGYASDLCFHQLRMTGGAQLRFQESEQGLTALRQSFAWCLAPMHRRSVWGSGVLARSTNMRACCHRPQPERRVTGVLNLW